MPIVAETREPTGHVATEHIAVETEASMPMDDIVAELASQQTDDAQAITSAARIIREGKQAEIRKLCKPWGVQLREKKASGKYGNRPDDILKNELKIVLTKRTIQLKSESHSSSSQLGLDSIANSSDAGIAPCSAHQAKSTVNLPDGRAMLNFTRASTPTEA